MSALESLIEARPRDGFKLHPKHREDCYLNAQGRQEFIVAGPGRWLDKRGSERHRTHLWHSFTCNMIGCPALALVRDDVLMEFIAEGLRGE